MAKLSANEAFDLAGELLADLELERLRLSSCAMKTARLARLLGDDDHFLIFKYEIAGYPSTPNGVQPEIWRLCLKALRVRKEKIKKEDSNTEEIVEKADLRSITSIEENAETLKLRLSYFQPQPISISSANPNQIISTPIRNVSLEAQIATNYRNEMTLLAARRAFIYDFVLSKLFELRVSSTAEDIFEEYRKKYTLILADSYRMSYVDWIQSVIIWHRTTLRIGQMPGTAAVGFYKLLQIPSIPPPINL